MTTTSGQVALLGSHLMFGALGALGAVELRQQVGKVAGTHRHRLEGGAKLAADLSYGDVLPRLIGGGMLRTRHLRPCSLRFGDEIRNVGRRDRIQYRETTGRAPF